MSPVQRCVSFPRDVLSQNNRVNDQVRLFLRRGLSVRYLLPNPVVDYIEQHGLYQDETATNASNGDQGKDRDKEVALQTPSRLEFSQVR